MTPRKKKQDPVAESEAPQESGAAGDPVAGSEPAVESGVAGVAAGAAADTGPAESGPVHSAQVPQVSSAQMVAFHLGSQRYGFEIDRVQEIQQIVAFAQVPSDTGAVLGLVNLRGQIVPAVDIRLLLGMEQKEHTLETPMVVCRSDRGPVAFVVDDVEDVVPLPPDCLQPPPRMRSLAGRMIGVCQLDDGMVFLLDVDKLIESVDLEVVGEESA